MSENEPFSPDELTQLRQHDWLADFEFHEQLASTNDRALQQASDEFIRSPKLFLAATQTAGRGRGTNSWWAKPGGLTFSVLLDAVAAGLTPEHFPRLSLTTGLAVAEAIQPRLPGGDVRLKWPNDVFLNERKVCGILVETTPRRPGRLVVGIGINVNNSFADAPDPLPRTAVCLGDVAGRSFRLADVLLGVLDRLADCLAILPTQPAGLLERWRGLCLLTGRTVQIDAGSRRTIGRCLGIDEAGALVVQTETGCERCFAGVVTQFERRGELASATSSFGYAIPS